MPTPSKKVLVPVSLLKRVITFSLIVNERKGVEECLFCSWSTPLISNEDVTRLMRLSKEEQAEWWRQFHAMQQHDKTCVVTRSRKLLGLANPRAVYVSTAEDVDDDTE